MKTAKDFYQKHILQGFSVGGLKNLYKKDPYKWKNLFLC